ncbi:LOW QUALITY PROTEIN: uncharacterized protein Dana_GF26556 [Drosophila ananassae]|uniref:Uncharacterized protein n=1 Tax=Drosophila ananassae TaxID=7217 RepID=A0A0P8XVN9_DROAN|nr:LOW QUALITY PROTEIN: uncharacterized protein Dana_GF26556 [Drosophila ananassae]
MPRKYRTLNTEYRIRNTTTTRFKELHCVLHMVGGVCVRLHGENFGQKDLQKVRPKCIASCPLALFPFPSCWEWITTAGHGRSIMPRIIPTDPIRSLTFDVKNLGGNRTDLMWQ